MHLSRAVLGPLAWRERMARRAGGLVPDGLRALHGQMCMPVAIAVHSVFAMAGHFTMLAEMWIVVMAWVGVPLNAPLKV